MTDTMARMRGTKDEPGQEFLFGAPDALPSARGHVASVENPIWTRSKARLIERYLYLFVQITKHGAYIDGFAGPQRADQPGMWAAKLVLESKPPFLRHFYLFDKNELQVNRLRSVVDNLPAEQKEHPRTIELECGDFNSKVHELLQSKKIGEKEAAFCLLDQRTFECRWSTVQAVARYKSSEYKIELFYFLPIHWLWRAMKALRQQEILTEWWGRSDVAELSALKQLGMLERFEHRFKTELGYRHVVPWPILGPKNKVMYYMIHATDHEAATPLMQRAYKMAMAVTSNQLPMF